MDEICNKCDFLITIGGDGTDAAATAYLANVTLSGGAPTSSAIIRATVKEGEIRSVQIVDGGANYDEDRVSLVVSSPDSPEYGSLLI